MTAPVSAAAASVAGRMPSPKQQFLDAYEREHAITMKVLRAYPPEKADLRPHPKCKTARELAWIFFQERGLGTAGLHDAFAKGVPNNVPAPPPDKWEDILSAIEQAHGEFRKTFESFTDEQLFEPIKFFGGPKTLVDYPRLTFAWFLSHDQIHHRGQMSVYLRMADAKVPSIYGPTADEPWL
jgi:uncharacterized damage-inducible protein DinB